MRKKIHAYFWRIALCSCLFSSCAIDFDSSKWEPEPKPEKNYNAEVLWSREVFGVPLQSHSAFFSPPLVIGPYGYFLAAGISRVTKINLETGKVIWESEAVGGRYQHPQKIGAYIYQPKGFGYIAVINDSNGSLAATVMLGDNETEAMDNDMWIEHFTVVSNDYLLWGNFPDVFSENTVANAAAGIMRLNTAKIDFSKDPYAIQTVIPELIWTDGGTQVTANILSENGILYFLNRSGMLIALNVETGAVIWERKMPHGEEMTDFPLALYNENILVITDNLSFYNKFTGDFIFKIADLDIDDKPYDGRLRYTLHNNFLYYINVFYSDIIAVNLDTGKIAWRNVIDSHYEAPYLDRHYYGPLAHAYGDTLLVMGDSGLRVYNTADGKFIGVDKKFVMEDVYSVLYNDMLVFFGDYPGTYGSGYVTAIRCK